MASTYSLFSTWLILLSVSQFANCQTCYWPNGENSGYTQCSSNGRACCYNTDDAHHDPCFSNGLCQSMYFGYIYRGACTDPNWGSSCPNVCTNGTTPSIFLPPYHISSPLSHSHQHSTDVPNQSTTAKCSCASASPGTPIVAKTSPQRQTAALPVWGSNGIMRPGSTTSSRCSRTTSASISRVHIPPPGIRRWRRRLRAPVPVPQGVRRRLLR